MDPSQIQSLIDNAVRQALAQQQSQLQSQINFLVARVQSLQVAASQIIKYEKISVRPDVMCDIPLDIIKSVAEFAGAQDEYVIWRV